MFATGIKFPAEKVFKLDPPKNRQKNLSSDSAKNTRFGLANLTFGQFKLGNNSKTQFCLINPCVRRTGRLEMCGG